MVRIVALNKELKPIKGSEKNVSEAYWTRLQGFGKSLRWKEVVAPQPAREETTKKSKGNGRKKRSGTGNAVKEA